VLEGHKHSYVTWVSFSPYGKLVATASADTTARIWDAATGQLLHTLGTPRADVE
jgi:WD40 repeat protein